MKYTKRNGKKIELQIASSSKPF